MIFREIRTRIDEGWALGSLGKAYYTAGELRRAVELYKEQLAITCETGDRHSQGHALQEMSVALEALGDRAAAIDSAEASLSIFDQIEDPNTAAMRKRVDSLRHG